jgi:hypothetical protein
MESGDLRECDTPVTGIPAFRGIKLKASAVESYQNTLKLLQANGFQKGDPILCLYDEPGVVYAMEGTSPGQAWYVYWNERDELNAHYLKQSHLSQAKRVFLIATCKSCLKPKVLATLAEKGMPLSSFVPIGTCTNPLSPTLTMHLYVHSNEGEKEPSRI